MDRLREATASRVNSIGKAGVDLRRFSAGPESADGLAEAFQDVL